jgi:cobalt-zinc-cadmium efflux system protein
VAHTHSHTQKLSGRRLLVTMLLNFFITVAEIVGGLLSGSLSLISDALHNFSDGIAIIITYIANRLSKKPNSFKYTFGLKRAEILAAILNASTLVIISFFLIKEAIERLSAPQQIDGNIMLIVAAGGFIANVIGTLLLKKDSDKNMNMKAAYLHLLSDAVSSLAVIIGAACIMAYNIYWIDPILTMIISLYIVRESFLIIKEASDVVMMSAPPDIDVKEVEQFITRSFPEITNVHHVHVWRMNDSDIHFEAHININDGMLSKTTALKNQLENALHERFELTHCTFQFECQACEDLNVIYGQHPQ